MTYISKYITYKEATKSHTALKYGIDNTPDDVQLGNMRYVAQNFFDPMREHFGKKIGVSSFFRAPLLNIKIGGSGTSFHPLGAAIDCDADIYEGITNRQIFDFFFYSKLPFSELIWEYGTTNEPDWVHIAALKGDERRMVKRAYYSKAKHIKKFDLY